MIGKAHRTQRQRSASWFYLVTALLLFASLFVVAGAQVASASQCGQVNNPPACSLAFRFENPAKSGSYTITNPHQAAANETITTVDLDPSGAPVVVEVEDANGHRATNYGGQITLTLTIITGTGTLTGDSAMAIDGAASFTNLSTSIGTKGYFQLTASATGAGITDSLPTNTFRIQADECASGQTCSDSAPMMDASLTNGGGGTVGLSVGIDGLSDCRTIPGGTSFYYAPAEWTVDEVRATSPTTKLLVVRIDKTWRQIVVDKGASSYRPCITATVAPPATWNNTGTIAPDFTFLAPDCSKTIAYFCRAYVKSNKSGDVLEAISLPSGINDVQGIPIDPRGH